MSNEFLDKAWKKVWGFRSETRSSSEEMNARMWFDRGADAGREQLVKDITFLWDWRVNQGFPFIRNTADVRAMRSLLTGTPIEEIPGFEWVKQAREGS